MMRIPACIESRSACRAGGSSGACSTMCTLMPPGSLRGRLMAPGGVANEAAAESLLGRLVTVDTTESQSQWGSATLKLHHDSTSALCWLQSAKGMIL